jgi:hypothetical protein
MRGLDPRIQARQLHVELSFMDARIKSGHDALMAGGAMRASSRMPAVKHAPSCADFRLCRLGI